MKNPSIVYNTPGVYDVTLTVTNALGNNVMTKVGYIIVSAAPVTIVTWNFPNNPDNALSDGGIPANNGTKSISVVGGVLNLGFLNAGATTRCASANTWAAGSGTKYWQVDFVTTGYQTLKVSSKMTGVTTAAPRDFKLQYKIGAGAWTDVIGGAITLASSNWSTPSANLTDISLPSGCDNQAQIFLRWILNGLIQI